MKTKTYKKLISIFMALILVISASVFAFADDDSAAVPEAPSGSASESSEADIKLPASNLPVTLTDEDTVQSDLELRQFSVNLARSIGAPDGTQTAADIYNLLYDVITHDPSGFSYFRVYDTDTHVFLQRIINILTDYSGTSSNTESPFYTSGDASSRLSIAQLLLVLTTNVLDLVEMDSSGSSSSLVQYLVNCYNTYISIDGKLSSILNCLTDDYGMTLANRLYDIKSVLFDMRGNELYYTKTWIGSIKDNTQNLINDLSSNGAIASSISSLQSDFNNISWTGYYSTIKYSGDLNEEFNDLPSSGYVTVGGDDIYFSYTKPSNINSTSVYKFAVPLHSSSSQTKNLIKNIHFYNNGEFLYPNFYYCYNQYNSVVVVYVYNLLWYQGELIIGFDTSSTSRVRPLSVTGNYQIYDISESSYDYYTVCQWINQNYQADIISQFKELYASDDLIQAKENQQQLEDSVLDDFTGSGSASASVSDAVDIKGVQSSLKGSLNTGDVNASGLSTILNTSSPSSDTSFFKFWTQDVYNDVNGLNNIPQTRSVNTYIFLNDSEELDRLIRSQSW